MPQQNLVQDVPLPTCQYTIRKEEIDGAVLRYANVGDQVVHRWECSSKDHGLLVHVSWSVSGEVARTKFA